jgi:cytochrome c
MRIVTAAAAAGLLVALAGCGSSNHSEATTSDSSASGPSETSASLAPGAPADFAVCTGCHTVVAGSNGIGPSLLGVVGRKAGSLPRFAYSAALRQSGIVWTPQKLDSWLSGPMTLVPGTKMSFGGYSDPKQRQAVIAYLKTLK